MGAGFSTSIATRKTVVQLGSLRNDEEGGYEKDGIVVAISVLLSGVWKILAIVLSFKIAQSIALVAL